MPCSGFFLIRGLQKKDQAISAVKLGDIFEKNLKKLVINFFSRDSTDGHAKNI